jgi:DNA-binding NarL/FixJ family response regulator
VDQIEEIQYPLSEQGMPFYVSLIRPWMQYARARLDSKIVFAAGTDPTSDDQVDTVARIAAAAIASDIKAAKGFAYDIVHTLLSAPSSTRTMAKNSPLPKKKHELRSLFDQAKLTERQQQCASLAWEHCITIAEIAKRLSIHRTTVEEYLDLAKIKLNRLNPSTKMKLRSALASSDDF